MLFGAEMSDMEAPDKITQTNNILNLKPSSINGLG